MNELIDTINTIVALLPEEALGAKNQAIIIKTKAEELLIKEKEQITNAYENGCDFGINDGGESADIYFEDTFC